VQDQLASVPIVETKLAPAGRGSLTLIPVAAAGPALATLIVYVRAPEAATGSAESDFVRDRLAVPAFVVSVSELLAGVLSLGEVTVAVFEMVPAVLGAVTLILMSGAVAPERSAAERVQVTVCGIEA